MILTVFLMHLWQRFRSLGS